MNTNETIIISLIVLGTLWFALRNRAAATPTASNGAVDLLEMMQPPPFDPNPVPTAAAGVGTPSDICRDYCAGRIVFFRDPGCNCQETRQVFPYTPPIVVNGQPPSGLRIQI